MTRTTNPRPTLSAISARFAISAATLVACASPLLGCRSARPASSASAVAAATPGAESQRARALLCGDIGEPACLASCRDDLAAREHVECLLQLRFGSDPAALAMARGLYANKHVLVGMDMRGTIDGYVGEAKVELFPALPVGDQRHHLEWVRSSLAVLDGFVQAIGARATKAVLFDPHPRALLFFRTGAPSYPSAYAFDGVIGYNLDGPLHVGADDVQATLVHEVFHLNDARRGGWSLQVLGPLFDSILLHCGVNHACFVPFAPYGTVVPGGTYYPFDARSADVREYAAELAVRYFLEQEEMRASGVTSAPPFKCATEENRIAWEQLAHEFFGDVDLVPPCDSPDILQVMPEASREDPSGAGEGS